MENAPQKLVILKDDIDLLNEYIEIEKLRFNNGELLFDVEIDNEIDSETTLIPPMIFQVHW